MVCIRSLEGTWAQKHIILPVVRVHVDAGVMRAEVETLVDAGTLVTLGGATNQRGSKDESSSSKQELCAGPMHQLNQ